MVRWILIGLVLAFPAQAETLQGQARVIDGDTLAIGRVHVRLHGIDAPEHDQMCQTAAGANWPCGQAAKARLTALSAGAKIRCVGADHDRYDRLIAVCTVGGRDLNATLVAEGMAEAYRKYARDYTSQEATARAARRGIWQGAHRAPEAERRAEAAPAPRPKNSGNCLIKGNISKYGQIYHLPGSRSYERTRINTAKGERWFCTIEDAVAAGWRAARG